MSSDLNGTKRLATAASAPGYADAAPEEHPGIAQARAAAAAGPGAPAEPEPPAPAEPDPEPPAPADPLAALDKVVQRNPLNREIHFKTLAFCCTRRLLPEVEDFIAACPEFASAEQSPYFLLQFLLKGHGIDSFEVDADGQVVTPEQKEGLSEDEIDDLVAQTAYETNAVGRQYIELKSPQNRLLELLGLTPEYYDTYIEVLGFLTEKRSLASVDSMLRGRQVLMANRDPDDRPVQPSVFIDKLERAGGIFWEKGWQTTPAGRELLQVLEERRG